MIATGTIWRVG